MTKTHSIRTETIRQIIIALPYTESMLFNKKDDMHFIEEAKRLQQSGEFDKFGFEIEFSTGDWIMTKTKK